MLSLSVFHLFIDFDTLACFYTLWRACPRKRIDLDAMRFDHGTGHVLAATHGPSEQRQAKEQQEPSASP